MVKQQEPAVYRYTLPDRSMIAVHKNPGLGVQYVYVAKKLRRRTLTWEQYQRLIGGAQPSAPARKRPSYRARHKHQNPRRKALTRAA